jgi:addiction module HigA family antidote
MAKLEPIHPGEILREEFMVPLDLSANALALALRVPVTRIGEIVRGRRAISPDTALRLARYFETTADLWLGLQAEYDLRLARRTLGEAVDREVRPRARPQAVVSA